MNYQKLVFSLMLFTLPGLCMAQKKKRQTAKKQVSEVIVEDPRITKMEDATQQIIFVDSVVVPKAAFLDHYLMGDETGRILTYQQFFRSDNTPYSTVYVNELGNKAYFAQEGRLFTSDLLGTAWATPEAVEGLEDFEHVNYPFVMADGTTLYFAAISDEGIGGLDIYRTRFDAEEGRFLKAENIGMPFNSTANDYMFTIDESNNIGYFATDRRQPQDSVCIYTFIPTDSRTTYSIEELGRERVQSYARIDRISDTWLNGKERKQALERISLLRTVATNTTRQSNQSSASFVINDALVYQNAADFKSADNRARFVELLQMREQYQRLSDNLQKSRNYYATVTSSERHQLRNEILQNEQDQLRLERDIKVLEKTIRNNELRQLLR